MPRIVRNFWIETNSDARKSTIGTGPKRKDGGFETVVYMRDKGQVVCAMRLMGVANTDGSLTLRVYQDGKVIATVNTDRDVPAKPKSPRKTTVKPSESWAGCTLRVAGEVYPLDTDEQRLTAARAVGSHGEADIMLNGRVVSRRTARQISPRFSDKPALFVVLARPKGYRGSGGGLASYPVRRECITYAEAVRVCDELGSADGPNEAADLWSLDKYSPTGLGVLFRRVEFSKLTFEN